MATRETPRRVDGSFDFSKMDLPPKNVVSKWISDQPATVRQLRYLQAVAREAGYDMAALDNRAVQEFGVLAAGLSRRDASTLIDLIQRDNRTWGTS